MTSPSQPATMRSSINNNTPPSDFAVDDNAFVLQPDLTLSDQNAPLTMAAFTSISAATPRTSRLLPQGPGSMMEAATALKTLDDTKSLTYTADVEQSPETMPYTAQPPTEQSSQLDSMLLSKLPRELRDKIYRDAVVEYKDIPIRVTAYATNDGERRRRLEIGHALMRACKQTRQEVAEIYYLENTFRVTEDLFEKRAIGELSRHLTPWVGKIAKLGVSHVFARNGVDLTKINFSISAFESGFVVEPESSSVRYLTYGLDVGQATARMVTQTSGKICFCKVSKLALEHDGRDVFSLLQDYVDLVLVKPECQVNYNHLLDLRPIHCWTCAGRNVI